MRVAYIFHSFRRGLADALLVVSEMPIELLDVNIALVQVSERMYMERKRVTRFEVCDGVWLLLRNIGTISGPMRTGLWRLSGIRKPCR